MVIIAQISDFVNMPKGIKTHFMQFHALMERDRRREPRR